MRAVRWVPAIVVAAAAAWLVLSALVLDAPQGAGTGSSGPVATTAAPRLTTPPAATPGRPAEAQVGAYLGPPYDTNVVVGPTASESQDKTWFNDGAWWSTLISQETGWLQIHRLDWAAQRWIDTGVFVDERANVNPDALWDGEHLYVASAGRRHAVSHAARVVRFSYDAADQAYVLDIDFPVRVTDSGVGELVIAKTGDGDLWMSYIAQLRVYVTHSSDAGLTWSSPFTPPLAELGVAADQAAMASGGGGVVLAWTNVREDALHLAIHENDAPDETWEVHSTAVEGLVYGEDELSIRVGSEEAGGSVFAAVRTSIAQAPNRNSDAAQIVLARFDQDGSWSQYVFGRVRDAHDAAIIALDESRDRVYVFAETGGEIYFKDGSISDTSFPSGLGTLMIESREEPSESAAGSVPSVQASHDPENSPVDDVAAPPTVDDPSTTKQHISELGELVLIASDNVIGRYAHAAMTMTGAEPPPVSGGNLGSPPPALPGESAAGAPIFLVRDTFAPFPPGSADATDWVTRPGLGDFLSVAEVTADDPSLRLRPSATGDGVRACKTFAPIMTGVVTARSNVRIQGLPESDATIVGLRWDGAEVAAARFGSTGTFRYFEGDVRIRSQVPYQPAVWYSSVMTLNLATQTYDWEIRPLDVDSPVFSISGLPLRAPAAGLDQICVEGASGLTGVELYVDDVVIELQRSE